MHELLATAEPLFSPLLTCMDREQEALRERIRHCTRPWLNEVDGWERDGHLPRSVFATLGDAGIFADRWAAGRAGGLPSAVTVASELALVCGGLGLAGTLHCEVFIGALQRRGGEARQRLLADALAGRTIGCFAVTEARGGSEIGGVTTTVSRVDDGWRLRGEKRYISNAGRASHAIVLAHSDEHPPGANLCLLVVPLTSPGVEVVGFYPKLGTHACDAAHLAFDVVLDDDAMLGPPGSGLISITQALVAERVAVSAQLVAVSHVALRLAVAHARQRIQFGQRLLDLQALRHRLADATSELWTCESMLNSVVLAAGSGRGVAHEASALKLRCAHTAGRVIDECLQVLGGRGYTSNYPLERLLRDARLARIGAGTDEIMRELVGSSLDRVDPRAEEWLARLDARDVAYPDAEPSDQRGERP